jgi:oxaloacetate decarboxylase beta subunit
MKYLYLLFLTCFFFTPALQAEQSFSVSKGLEKLWAQTGIYRFMNPVTEAEKEADHAEAVRQLELQGEKVAEPGIFPAGVGQLLMIVVGLLLIWLAISKKFEPLLLLPIGFGAILTNIPGAGIAEMGLPGQPAGFLYYFYTVGVKTGVFPLLIFLGVGAMTDFGPLLANPKTALLGAAAQFGIFLALIGALVLDRISGGAISFSLADAASIGIIGGADGPTAIFLASRLSPHLLGAIAVAAYSYMALVPILQPPLMRLFTTEAERKIEMKQLREVGQAEKIVFPLMVLILCILLLPPATPLIGMLMLGNLMKESGVVDRLSDTAQNSLINIITILLGLAVGSKLAAEEFLNVQTLGIILLGLVAFSIGTIAGILMAKLMNLVSKDAINPLIGSAGVSAVPMAARVANRMGQEANPQNVLIMHAMGPNVAGVIGSAVAAGVLLALVGG